MGRKKIETSPEVTEETEPTEEVLETKESEETKTEDTKLSRRDALEVALVASKDEEKREPTTETQDEASAKATKEEIKKEEAPLHPPGEWEKEDKELFYQSSRAQQEAALKLHHKRNRTLEEIHSAKRELEDVRSLAQALTPYLRANGIKDPSEVAMKKALKMWQEFEEGDPKKSAAAYLRAKGIEPPKELLEGVKADPTEALKPIIAPLLEEVNSLKSRIAQEDFQRAGQTLSQIWSSFEQEKNGAGTPRFLDSSSIEIASQVGSLVSGKSELSKQFIANTKARIPDLTYPRLLEEAYKWCGGRVDDSEAPRSQDAKKHVLKSSMAASSKPGSGSRPVSSVAKKLSRREALAQALQEMKTET